MAAIATRIAISAPLNSAMVSPEASLDELREIKAAWTAQAAEIGYLDACWNVLRWLGSPVHCLGHNKISLWQSADNQLAIIGSETRLQYLPDQSAWQVKRGLSAWLRNSVEAAFNQDILRDTQNPVDAVIFSGNCVVRHTWTFAETGNPVLVPEAGGLFIPGQWIARVLAVTADAKAAMMHTVSDAGESERSKLLAELLVGQSI